MSASPATVSVAGDPSNTVCPLDLIINHIYTLQKHWCSKQTELMQAAATSRCFISAQNNLMRSAAMNEKLLQNLKYFTSESLLYCFDPTFSY